ncbi:MAG: T9SS type A sorting domain-containing protein [Bacteroidetes bacterium]|nr:T9SS type A sorting domain-containing protein [Bacteroidota bacterium]
MKKALLSLVLPLCLIGNMAFSQVPWSTVKPPLGTYNKLPNKTVQWENPNRQTTYYYTPVGVLAVGPNVRVLPNSNEQDELYLSYNSQLPNLMFGSANTTVGSSYGQGVYVSTNGGVTWYGTDLMPNEPSSTSDPAPAIDKNGTFVFTSLNTAGTAFMYGQYSTNYGVNWSSPVTIYSGSSDKNLSASDDVPSSPYYGRTYTVWTVWSGSYPIGVSYTTNGGVSWSTYQAINNPSSTSQGCDVVVGPNPAGVVYVCWSKQSTVSTGVGFAKSTNGGVNWTVNESAYACNGIRDNSNFGGWGVRVNDFPRIAVDKSGGTRNGWIYIVDAEKNLSPAGSDADVILHRSTDGGSTWSAGIRVNQDAINNGKLQFFPVVCVDGNGGVNVLYYDNRNYASTGDSCETYMSRSIDGGNTWTDIKVSDHRWKPVGEGGSGTYMGDYIGLAFSAGKLWPFWFDNKTGHMQAWTAPIDVGPSIAHTPLGNTELITGNRVVNCTITPAGSGINPSTAKLYYAKNSTSFTSVALTNSSGNNWTANLPLSGAGTYNYYLTATDSLSRTVTAPAGAPSSYYSFLAAADTVKPVIATTPLGNVPKATWPATVSANVTDNIGVDSVWVRWYKNSTSNGWKQFKLLNTSGSTYAAAFNSTQAEVNYNDSIFYRVIARDNSSNHNADSTALYSFKIINITNACVGTGTVSSNYPFTSYWMDGRTQMLFTASELTAAGLGSGMQITKLGFNVISNSTQLLNGFNVRFQLTSQTSLTGWVTSGWTTGYSGTYTVPGTGWQYIDMTSPYFTYNGTSNLLIEVCYDNTSYSSYSPVNSTAAAGMTYGYYTDNSTGCTMTGGAVQANRPNVCFTVTSLGAESNLNLIPTKYELTQNYPNPFNPTTKINFAIPKQGLVTMKIYDVLGREVKTLVNEVKQAGNYTVDFNAAEFASGVYFYKLQSGDFSDIKRMILVK